MDKISKDDIITIKNIKPESINGEELKNLYLKNYVARKLDDFESEFRRTKESTGSMSAFVTEYGPIIDQIKAENPGYGPANDKVEANNSGLVNELYTDVQPEDQAEVKQLNQPEDQAEVKQLNQPEDQPEVKQLNQPEDEAEVKQVNQSADRAEVKQVNQPADQAEIKYGNQSVDQAEVKQVNQPVARRDVRPIVQPVALPIVQQQVQPAQNAVRAAVGRSFMENEFTINKKKYTRRELIDKINPAVQQITEKLFIEAIAKFNKTNQKYRLVVVGGTALNKYIQYSFRMPSYDWDIHIVPIAANMKVESDTAETVGYMLDNFINTTISKSEGVLQSYILNILKSIKLDDIPINVRESYKFYNYQKRRLASGGGTVDSIMFSIPTDDGEQFELAIADIDIQNKQIGFIEIELRACIDIDNNKVLYAPIYYILYNLYRISIDKTLPKAERNRIKLIEFNINIDNLNCNLKFEFDTKIYNIVVGDVMGKNFQVFYERIASFFKRIQAVFKKLCNDKTVLTNYPDIKLVYNGPKNELIDIHSKFIQENDKDKKIIEYTYDSAPLNTALIKNYLYTSTNNMLIKQYYKFADMTVFDYTKLLKRYIKEVNELTYVARHDFTVYKLVRYFSLRNTEFASPESFTIGQIIYQPCFVSTSYKRDIETNTSFVDLGSACCLFEINVPATNTDYIIINTNGGIAEAEILFQPGISFKINSKRMGNLKYKGGDKKIHYNEMFVFTVDVLSPEKTKSEIPLIYNKDLIDLADVYEFNNCDQSLSQTIEMVNNLTYIPIGQKMEPFKQNVTGLSNTNASGQPITVNV